MMTINYKEPPDIFTSECQRLVARGPLKLLRAPQGSLEHWQLVLSTGLRICRRLIRDKRLLAERRAGFHAAHRNNLFGQRFRIAAKEYERQHTVRFVEGIMTMLLVGYMDVIGTKQVRQVDWVPLRALLRHPLGVGNLAEHRDPDYYFFNAVRAKLHRMRRKYGQLPFKCGRRYLEIVAEGLQRRKRAPI